MKNRMKNSKIQTTLVKTGPRKTAWFSLKTARFSAKTVFGFCQKPLGFQIQKPLGFFENRSVFIENRSVFLGFRWKFQKIIFH